MVSLCLGLGQKYRKKILCCRPLIRVRTNIEKDTLCYRPLVMVSAKIEKTPFVVGLRSRLGRKHKQQFVVGIWLGLGQK